MKGFAAGVPGGLFGNMLAMEMPAAGRDNSEPLISGKQVGALLVRMLTDINLSDPKSLLAHEYPGMNADSTILLRPGSSTDATVGPEDREPLPANGGTANETGDGSGRPDHGPEIPDGEGAPSTNTAPPASSGSNNAEGTPDKPTTGGRNVVFIYHSHNRESWIPELKTDTNDPTSPTINVTLLGKRLALKLKSEGIGAVDSSVDYASAIKNYNWALSYKYSKKTVIDALSSNKDLKFLFDIHRDSQRRKYTTATINGKDYAQVFFIIGHANPNWRKNEAFANEIHEALEKKYPGISRGVWGKTTANGNGEYNQSLAPDSVLIEIGGVDNTLEESYRTVDALAGVIAKLYWNAEKVSVPRTDF
jgi:stage II sporulation protein P